MGRWEVVALRDQCLAGDGQAAHAAVDEVSDKVVLAGLALTEYPAAQPDRAIGGGVGHAVLCVVLLIHSSKHTK